MDLTLLAQDFVVSLIISLISVIQVAAWGIWLFYRYRKTGRLERRWFVPIVISGFILHRLLSEHLQRILYGVGW